TIKIFISERFADVSASAPPRAVRSAMQRSTLARRRRVEAATSMPQGVSRDPASNLDMCVYSNRCEYRCAAPRRDEAFFGRFQHAPVALALRGPQPGTRNARGPGGREWPTARF